MKQLYTLFFLLPIVGFAQLEGTKQIPSANYPTIKVAIDSVNLYGIGVSGCVFEVAAGHTEISDPAELTKGGSSTGWLEFVKTGIGTNPLITKASVGTLNPANQLENGDAIIAVTGASYIKFSGIDIKAISGASNPEYIEYGFYLQSSFARGCKFINIEHCSVELNKNNRFSIGYFARDNLFFYDSLLIHSNLTITENYFSNMAIGVYLGKGMGFSSTLNMHDIIINNNIFSDLGNNTIVGGAGQSSGAIFCNASATDVSFNNLQNILFSGGQYYSGIRVRSRQTLRVFQNEISITATGIGTSGGLTLIDANTSGDSLRIESNHIHHCNIESSFYDLIFHGGGSTTKIIVLANIYEYNTITSSRATALFASGSSQQSLVIQENISRYNRFIIAENGCYYFNYSSFSTKVTTDQNIFLKDTIDMFQYTSGIFRIINEDTTYVTKNTIDSCVRLGSNGGFSPTFLGIVNLFDVGANLSNNNAYTLIKQNKVTNFRMNPDGNGSGGIFRITERFASKTYIFEQNIVSKIYLQSTTDNFTGQISLFNYDPSSFVLKNVNIKNNLISHLSGWSSVSICNFTGRSGGINPTDSFFFEHNTIYLPLQPFAVSTKYSPKLFSFVEFDVSLNIKFPFVGIKNNIIVNELDAGTDANSSSSIIFFQDVLPHQIDTARTQVNFLNNLYFTGTSNPKRNILRHTACNSPTASCGSFPVKSICNTLADLKRKHGPLMHNASVYEEPVFLSTDYTNPDFLRLNTAIASQAESAGTPQVNAKDDFEGNLRNASTPDMGAYEFTGILNDITGPTIDFTSLDSTSLFTNRTIEAYISDLRGVATGAAQPLLYFKKQSDLTYVSSAATSITADKYTFEINYALLTTPPVLGDTIYYYIAAQDLSSNSNVHTWPFGGSGNTPPGNIKPDSVAKYHFYTALGGTYTVGTGGNYPTLTGPGGLFEAMNTTVVNANITAEIISDITEPGTVALNQWTNVGSNLFTLTIKPSSATLFTLSGNNALSILKFNGADRVTLDGRYNGTGAFLKIENTSPTNTSTVIWVASASTTNGATNNTFRNCFIEGASRTTTFIAVCSSSGVTVGSAAQFANSNNVYDSLIIKKCQYAIALVGVSGNEANNIVRNCILGSTVTSEKLRVAGIAAFQQNNCIIENNVINGLDIEVAGTGISAGIRVAGTAGTISILQNTISDIKNTSGTGTAVSGIMLSSSSTGATLKVFNNVVYDIASTGSTVTAANNGFGIYITSGAGFYIYHNSVNLNTNQGADGLPAALHVTSGVTSAGSVRLRNNILAVTATTGTNRYAIYSSAAGTVFSSISNNNLFFSGDAPNLGFVGGVNRASLTDIITGFGGNILSTHGNPGFTAGDNLIPLSGNDLFAQYLPFDVTIDRNGSARSTTYPTMGAYEVSMPGIWNGLADNNWNNPSNWYNTQVPANNTSIYIHHESGSVIPIPVLPDGLNFTGRRLIIQSSQSIQIPATSSFNTTVAVLNSGTIGGSGKLILGGTKQVLINGTGNYNTVELNNTVGALISASSSRMNVFTKYIPTAGTLTTNGNFTLKSATETAYITAGTTGYINGTIIAEKTIVGGGDGFPADINQNSKRGFRFFAHPFNGDISLNQLTGTGEIDITGNAAGLPNDASNCNGCAATLTNAPSAFRYDVNQITDASANGLTNGWKSINNLTSTSGDNSFKKGKGLRIFYRGSKNQGLYSNSNYTVGNAVIAITGTPNTGNVDVDLDYNATHNVGWTLVGNPYASNIQLGNKPSIERANLNHFYVWVPGLGRRGNYETVNFGSSYILPAYASFFVNATAAAQQINFKEVDKVDDASTQVLLRSNPKQLVIALQTDSLIWDYLKIGFDSSFSKNADDYDAVKWFGSNDAGVYTKCSDSLLLAFDARPMAQDTIPVGIFSNQQRSFVFNVVSSPSIANVDLYLKDNYLQTLTKITPALSYPFHTNNDTASQGQNRFSIVVRNQATLPISKITLTAHRNTNGIAVNWNTIQETNMRSHILQKSFDGQQFQDKITVAAQNRNSNNYEWIDQFDIQQRVYYRVKSIGLDESISFSSVAMVEFKNANAIVKATPNLITNQTLNLQLTSLAKGSYIVSVHNIAGQQLETHKFNHSGRNGLQTFRLKTVANGIYSISLINTNGEIIHSEKIVVQSN